MFDSSENKAKNRSEKHICVGLLAHVDAGKTTLSEMLLYLAGQLRQVGRVDHGDAFLDTFALEKERGITIFSKQAELTYGKLELTLLDTPGHVDFSAEMERTLQVLDAAVLVISGADGVQSHTKTLWRLLRHYRIPTFLFINKMDLERFTKAELMEQLQRELSGHCIDLSEGKEPVLEEIALCREDVLEAYLETNEIADESIRQLTENEQMFPCFFGSALKGEGVEELLKGLEAYSQSEKYEESEARGEGNAQKEAEACRDAFGARVYKITRDGQGTRLTHMKVTGGILQVKQSLGEGDKVDQIRIYSGSRYETRKEVGPGTICAVTGCKNTLAGQGLGTEEDRTPPLLEPVLRYRLLLPFDCNVQEALSQLRQLEEEDPKLHLLWEEGLKEIHLQIMGQVQLEILKSTITERFGWVPDFSEGSILYKETVAEPMVGVGHYEPLRHYAEVQLLLEPGETGSGLQFSSICSEDALDRNWQRLILTHLAEREHPGVLVGGPITDMKITLVAGKAHLKHTEGGDFRQATYRAVRQGLKKAECRLLEPMYQFTLEVPTDCIGRAMTDLERRCSKCGAPVIEGDFARLEGSGPVATLQDYAEEVAAYTGGRGQFFCALKGYDFCHNEAEVLEACAYDSERDLENPTGSVFCSHGAGFVVPWAQVDSYKHLKWEGERTVILEEASGQKKPLNYPVSGINQTGAEAAGDAWEKEKELEQIFEQTFGKVERKRQPGSSLGYEKPRKKWGSSRTESGQIGRAHGPKPKKAGKEYLLVDGYNIIFAWEELKALAQTDLHGARMRLMDILSNYQGYRRCTVILVFDAYKVKGNPGSMERYQNLYVVYTKEAETADMYIEKTTHEIARDNQVTVATSDGLEQMIVIGNGATRLSAQGLYDEISRVETQIREHPSVHGID